MTSTRPNFTPVYENGTRKEIQGMAASSIGRQFYQVSTCDDCGASVAWAKSTKTGRWYVCETAEYSTDTADKFRAVPYRFHTCRVAPTASPDRLAAEAAAYALLAEVRAEMADNKRRSAE